MSEAQEPLITFEELIDRRNATVEAISKTVDAMHAKLGITSSEAIAALSSVIYTISMTHAMMNYEIPLNPKASVDVP